MLTIVVLLVLLIVMIMIKPYDWSRHQNANEVRFINDYYGLNGNPFWQRPHGNFESSRYGNYNNASEFIQLIVKNNLDNLVEQNLRNQRVLQNYEQCCERAYQGNLQTREEVYKRHKRLYKKKCSLYRFLFD